jgi:hypothetical protein
MIRGSSAAQRQPGAHKASLHSCLEAIRNSYMLVMSSYSVTKQKIKHIDGFNDCLTIFNYFKVTAGIVDAGTDYGHELH